MNLTFLNEEINKKKVYVVFDKDSSKIVKLNSKFYFLLESYCNNKSKHKDLLQQYSLDEDIFSKKYDEFRKNLLSIKENKCYLNEDSLSLLRLNISSDCNLRCSYCYADYGKYNEGSGCNMKFETIEKAIDSAYKIYGNVEKIGFFGGEPLLHQRGIRHAIDYIDKNYSTQNIVFNVNTNGTIIIDNDLIKKLNFFVSVDGPPKYHNAQRKTIGGGDSYEKILANLKHVKNINKDFTFVLTATYTAKMKNDGLTISDVYSYLSKDFGNIGLKGITINPSFLSNDYNVDLLEFYIEVMDLLFLNYDNDIFYGDLTFIELMYRFLFKLRSNYLCSAGRGSITVSTNGNIYPCHLCSSDTFKISNVLKEDYKAITLDIDRFIKETKHIFSSDIDFCNDCWLKYFCLNCIAKFNFQKNDDFCEFNKKIASRLIVHISEIKSDKEKWQKFNEKIKHLKEM